MPPFSEHAKSELFEGGYYSIIDGDQFAIAKVLKIDPEIVHVRIYKEHFAQRPRSVDPGQLTLGSVFDNEGFGMSHLPLSPASFMERQPFFITHSDVQPDELKGYEVWKEVKGGVWE